MPINPEILIAFFTVFGPGLAVALFALGGARKSGRRF